MAKPQPHKTIAIGSLIWSLAIGAGGLVLIRALQVTNSHSRAEAFPSELTDFYVVVVVLLAFVVRGVLRRRRWTARGLAIVLLAVPVTTFFYLRTANWAPDFLRLALGVESVWLCPWVVLLGQLFYPPE